MADIASRYNRAKGYVVEDWYYISLHSEEEKSRSLTFA